MFLFKFPKLEMASQGSCFKIDLVVQGWLFPGTWYKPRSLCHPICFI